MRRIAITIACIALLAVQGCKKKDAEPFDNDPVRTITWRYLTQAAWRQTALEYQQSSGAWVAKPLPAAALSRVTTYYMNGTVTEVTGSASVSGIFDIIGDNHQLAVNKSVTYDFAALNDTTMQLVLPGQQGYTDTSTGIITTYYAMRMTYGH